MYDLMEGLGQPYMIPFNMYAAGSYFGDSDLLADKEQEGRDGTAMVDLESMVLVMTKVDLNYVLSLYKNSIRKEMKQIAKDRRNHHIAAINELKLQNQHVKTKLMN